jgi:hypothetical protein
MLRRSLIPSSALVLALALADARPAEATTLRLGLEGSYWFVHEGVFNIDFAVTVPIASFLSVGGRFGGALVTGRPLIAVPLDLLLHIPLQRVYLEVAGGPWIFFEGDTIRAHVTFGFGLTTGPFSFGVEAGYLDPRGIIGGRFGYRF